MDRKVGAIFDWDGVIINSAAHHETSWERLAVEVKKPLPEGHFKRGFGMKNEVIFPELLGWTAVPTEVRILSLRKEALYREIVREKGIEPLPGVREFLQAFKDHGIPCVIGVLHAPGKYHDDARGARAGGVFRPSSRPRT